MNKAQPNICSHPTHHLWNEGACCKESLCGVEGHLDHHLLEEVPALYEKNQNSYPGIHQWNQSGNYQVEALCDLEDLCGQVVLYDLVDLDLEALYDLLALCDLVVLLNGDQVVDHDDLVEDHYHDDQVEVHLYNQQEDP